MTIVSKEIHKTYTLREGRIYRITGKRRQWVVPKGMIGQVVRAAHDELGHFAVEKTLHRLCKDYWFSNMKDYVPKYIACCVRCICSKKSSDKKEFLLHPIENTPTPFHTLHIDHLGPLPKTRKGNLHFLVTVDAFTKFVILKPTKSTKTAPVISALQEIFTIFGSPVNIISDQGTAFTSAAFGQFCKRLVIKHIKNAVATPRANGQVERVNRTLLNSLLATTLEQSRWDNNVFEVQFSINNVVSRTTGKTPTELLMGFHPRHGNVVQLTDEIADTFRSVGEVQNLRDKAVKRISKDQA